jgi:hypothetical protein
VKVIFYTKIGCHLCEGLAEKLASIDDLDLTIEEREITTNPEWMAAYQYEVPVLYCVEGDLVVPIPRLSPRASVAQLKKLLLESTQNR